MSKIDKVKAREIIDSRGNPTVEVDIVTRKGLSRASVPSGVSTGKHEALELRDNNRRYLGKGVRKAVSNINSVIAEQIVGRDCTQQAEIDELMIALDGTTSKSSLGANSILAVSMAVCKAGATASETPLYAYISHMADCDANTLPTPQMNVINGGAHAGIENDFQEHMIVPVGAETFSDALRLCSETYHILKKTLKTRFGPRAIQVGDEGGFVPPVQSIDERFELILQAIEELGYLKEFALATDVAASEFYYDGEYRILEKQYSSEELVDFYSAMCERYRLVSIEDGLHEDDWDGWVRLNSSLGAEVQIVGDDLLATNTQRIRKAAKLNACNALLLKLNQIGTVTEALDAFKLARQSGWSAIVSHRSGSTEETFFADLAVGLDAGQFKYGAPARGERTCNYNQLLRIEEELGHKAQYSHAFAQQP